MNGGKDIIVCVTQSHGRMKVHVETEDFDGDIHELTEAVEQALTEEIESMTLEGDGWIVDAGISIYTGSE